MTPDDVLRIGEEACRKEADQYSRQLPGYPRESLEAAAGALAKLRADLPGVIGILRRGIGAIEACAMEKRGVAVAWTAVDETQDEMRRILARLDPPSD